MSLAVAPSPSIHKSALLIPKPYPKSFWSPSSSIHSTSTLYRPTQSSEGSKMPASAVPARPVASRRSSVASNTSSKAIPTPAIPAKLLSIGEKDTSSSSGTVFAKPTKEWVIPERAKPGRKVAAEDPDNKRQTQNRISQRAHRARRTDYITTLEERIRQFEADEIHSNVRLQEVARALKADNEKLRVEVAALRAQVGDTEKKPRPEAWDQVRRQMEHEIKALRDEVRLLRSRSRSSLSQTPNMSNPMKPDTLMPGDTPDSHALQAGSDQIPRKVLDCPICPNPDPDCPCQQPQPLVQESSLLLADGTSSAHPPPSHTLSREDHDCDFCKTSEDCLCAIVDAKPVVAGSEVLHSPDPGFHKDEGCGLCATADFCACKVALSESPPMAKRSFTTFTASGSSSLTVPLKLRARTDKKPSIWALTTEPSSVPIVAPVARGEAVCTGDPSNCDACKNDSFGQEFCSHLFASHNGPCPTCTPSSTRTPPQALVKANSMDDFEAPRSGPILMTCCGKPGLCGHQGGGCSGEVIGIRGSSNVDVAEVSGNTMRPEQAWKALKAHPNAKLASLALLADVVARRNTGSRSPLPPHSSAPSSPSTRAVKDALAHAEHHGKRKIEVETSAVRDALRVLDEAGGDGHSTPTDGQERVSKRRRQS